MFPFIAAVALVTGALIALLNFYLSFLRDPIHRRLGRSHKWASGIPLLGSALLVLGAFLVRTRPALFWAALALALVDTGGIHWFLSMLIWKRLRPRPSESR